MHHHRLTHATVATAYTCRHQVMSRYTSMIAVDEESRQATGALKALRVAAAEPPRRVSSLASAPRGRGGLRMGGSSHSDRGFDIADLELRRLAAPGAILPQRSGEDKYTKRKKSAVPARSYRPKEEASRHSFAETEDADEDALEAHAEAYSDSGRLFSSSRSSFSQQQSMSPAMPAAMSPAMSPAMPAAMSPAGPRSASKSPESLLAAIAMLQTARGFWEYSHALQQVFLTSGIVLGACPVAGKDTIWATVLCLAFMRERLQSLAQDWEMVRRTHAIFAAATAAAACIFYLRENDSRY